MTTISPEYAALNAELHRTRKDYGRRGGRHAGTPAALRKPGVASLVSLWRALEQTALEPV